MNGPNKLPPRPRIKEYPDLRPGLHFRLAYSKKGIVVRHKTDEVDKERLASLKDIPPGFAEYVGDYASVSAEAVRRNAAQLRSSFLDYLYYPESIKTKEASPA